MGLWDWIWSVLKKPFGPLPVGPGVIKAKYVCPVCQAVIDSGKVTPSGPNKSSG